jgi:hypothetical protein
MKSTAIALSMAFLLAGSLSLNAADDAKTCPMSKGCAKDAAACAAKVQKEIDLSHCCVVKGKTIYTSCKEHADSIKANPDKFVKELEASGVKFDSLKKGNYYIDKKKDAVSWDYNNLREIVTPIDMAVPQTTGDNMKKVVGDNMKKVDGDNMKKVDGDNMKKIVTLDTPKIVDPVQGPHLPAPGK